MKTFLLLICTLTLALPLFGQYSRTEITKPTDHDSKPNNESVPDVYAVSGNFERIVILRMKFKTDLLAGLQKGIETEGIKNGVILAGIGSVRGYHIHVVSNRNFPSKNYMMKDPTRDADIISMNGYIMDGRVHPHITLADEMESFGGHLEPETEVFTFAIITIGVFPDDMNLERLDDKTYR
ncbi:MAG: DNA-binding protein [Verrucomicrobia bacterium]|nr:DNA-binding protein [Verrucomicrobiota bacterium]MDA1068433.1 DNA-binding protein [Verrucomicrobiota bacterium]